MSPSPDQEQFRDPPERFHVAFSYAGEERQLVEAIAIAVEAALGRSTVFFAPWFEHYLAGRDADIKLQEVYARRCQLVVACVSERYGEKAWTEAEYEAIRARARHGREPDNVLEIRVGEGEVKGLPDNAIVPDVRGRSIEKTAELILARLHLVDRTAATVAAPVVEEKRWPLDPKAFDHALADRSEKEWPAVLQLLTHSSAKRILVFEGPTGHSKSALLSECFDYARGHLRVATAFVDFRDDSLVNEAAAIRELQSQLGRSLKAMKDARDLDRWTFVDLVREIKEPTLIVFDTYEKAVETKALAEWIESKLLAEVEESTAVRFIIAGQKIPATTRRWAQSAEFIRLGPITDQNAWKTWIQKKNPKIEDKHIEAFVLCFQGVPANISTQLQTLSQALQGA